MNALLILLNHLGNFPSASGPATVSTLVSETDILADIAAQVCREPAEAEAQLQHVHRYTHANVANLGADRCQRGAPIHALLYHRR
jgi:hypothetical protein